MIDNISTRKESSVFKTQEGGKGKHGREDKSGNRTQEVHYEVNARGTLRARWPGSRGQHL